MKEEAKMPKKNKNPLISTRNPFDEVKALFSKEYGKIKLVRPFMVNKLLSFLPSTFLLAKDVNEHLNGMPKYLYNMILNIGVEKKEGDVYLRYPKKIKKTDEKLRQKISETFTTNYYHSNQIIDLLRKRGVNPEEYFGLKKGE